VLRIDYCSRRLVPRLQAQGYGVTYREFDGPHTVRELHNAALQRGVVRCTAQRSASTTQCGTAQTSEASAAGRSLLSEHGFDKLLHAGAAQHRQGGTPLVCAHCSAARRWGPARTLGNLSATIAPGEPQWFVIPGHWCLWRSMRLVSCKANMYYYVVNYCITVL
jgi:hypothetical protein